MPAIRGGWLEARGLTRGRGGRGTLRIEGVPVADIAAQTGTPAYVYAGEVLTREVDTWRRAFEARGLGPDRHGIRYAVKANGALVVLDTLRKLGVGFDIVSRGELHRVLAVGADPRSVVFSGAGKTREELEAAVDARVGVVNVESIDEAATLSEIAGERGVSVDVGLRLNPDIDPDTHPAVATGPATTKFGMLLDEIRTLVDDRERLSGLNVRAAAVHVGSQIRTIEPIVAGARSALALARELRGRGLPVSIVDVGGGLGIDYEPDSSVPSAAELAAGVADALADWDGTLITEPGRALAGRCGLLLTRVVAVRRRGGRSLVVCDAGMNALLRPALYGARHAILPVAAPRTDAVEDRGDVVGPLCEAGDVLATDVRVRAEAGDLLAVCDVGAYGAVMASEYNAVPRPPEVWVSDGRIAVVRPRRTLDELIEAEVADPWQRS